TASAGRKPMREARTVTVAVRTPVRTNRPSTSLVATRPADDWTVASATGAPAVLTTTPETVAPSWAAAGGVERAPRSAPTTRTGPMRAMARPADWIRDIFPSTDS